MKVFTLITCFLLLSTGVIFGQKIKEKDRTNFEILSNQKDSAALELALFNKDYDAAAVLSYRLLVNDEKNIKSLYKLAEIHFSGKKFNLAINSCRNIITLDSLNVKAFKLAARSFINLKQGESAAGVYQLMYSRFNEVNYLYEKAIVQFNNKQNKESLSTLSAILSDTTSLTKTIEITNKNENNKVTKQNIPIEAAAYNVAGYILLQEKNYKLAKVQFEASIKISPEFIFANNNLRKVLTLEAEPKTPDAGKTK